MQEYREKFNDQNIKYNRYKGLPDDATISQQTRFNKTSVYEPGPGMNYDSSFVSNKPFQPLKVKRAYHFFVADYHKKNKV